MSDSTSREDIEDSEEEIFIPDFQNLNFDNFDLKGLDLFNKSSKPGDRSFPLPNGNEPEEDKQ